jgi:BON domain
MRRARQKRSTSVLSATATVPATASGKLPVLETVGVVENREDHESLPDCNEQAVADRVLEAAVRQRIETRLRGRVQELHVRVVENVVYLEGRCATYYTKQLAQHAAMGIIEDEHLENLIVVRCASEAW